MSEDFHQKMVLKYGNQKYLQNNWQYKKSRKKTKLIYGVGINDVEFSVQPNINGKQLKHTAYQVWSDMLQRAYSDRYKSTRPTYIGVTVVNEWKTFSTFLSWFNNHYIPGFALDKDILIEGNKIYGPKSCIFVPASINSFLTLHNSDRGAYSIGVS